MTNFSSLRLADIVLHQVLLDESDSANRFMPDLTDAPIEIEPADRGLLTRRFRESLTRSARPIVEDETAGSPVPSHIRSQWSGASTLVQASREMASFLSQVQPGTSLPGLLVVAEAYLGAVPALLVAKVEHQEAMRLEATQDEQGRRTYQMERIRQLVFGEGARVYKTVLLPKEFVGSVALTGDAADEQNSARVASYFLRAFLGMKLREEPPVLTQQVLDGMTGAVNASSMSSEQKADVMSAVLAELKSNKVTVKTRQIIQDHVPLEHQSELFALAEERHVPTTEFTKDDSLIRNKLTRMRVSMSNDVVILVPHDEIGPGKSVEITQGDDPAGGDVVTVRHARVTSVAGNGGR